MRLLNFNINLLISGMITLFAVFQISLIINKGAYFFLMTPFFILYLIVANILYLSIFLIQKWGKITIASSNPEERIHNSVVYLFHSFNIIAAFFLISTLVNQS